MKTKTRFQRLILWISLSLILCLQISKAQNALPGTREDISIKLSGDRFKAEDMVLKVDAVFAGEITQLEMSSTKMAGTSVYRNTQVNIAQLLRGSVEPQSTFTLYVASTASNHEVPPKVGNAYIFFVKKNSPGQPDPYIVIKLLPATDDNIAKVKALIAAAPVSK